MIAFFATPIGRWLVIAALVLAAMAWSYTKGVERESDRRDAIALEVERQEHARYAGAVRIGNEAAKQAETGTAAAVRWGDTWRQKHDELQKAGVPLIVGAKCVPRAVGADPGASNSGPVAVGADLDSSDLRLSWGFVGLWDGAWTGRDGQPLFGNTVQLTAPLDIANSASPYRIDDALSRHEENAARCSEDRRQHDALIELIDKLEKKWDLDHK